MFYLLFIGYSQLVVFLNIQIAALTHLFLREARLFAQIALVHLCFQYTELVGFCLSAHSQSAIARGTVLQTEPEIGKFVNDLGVVTDSTAQITRVLQQQRTIKECHEVVGLKIEHKIEVGDSAVVVTHLSA